MDTIRARTTRSHTGMRAVPRAFFLGLAMAVAAMTLATSGCGYQLRGVTEVDPTFERVYVSGLSTSNPVYRSLAAEIDNSEAVLVDDRRDATARLVVESDSVEQRASVVDPSADVRQYELLQELSYHIELPDGSRTPSREISQARNYNYDPTGVLASSSNEGQIRRELGELVGQLLFYRLLAPIDPDTLIAPADGR
ncbi:LPS assembly lipoprotein LptE [Guyparkeria sp. TX1]|uniref:LPS-assembly lipoprotein LptE n=1 Tax=Guyparkeria sp. TX1 TaxID=3115001 RepID=UPI0039775234